MYKSKLQELCHQQAWDLPVYATVKDGPDHCPRFTTTVTVIGIPFESPQNQCKSSKEAQNVAAKLAYDSLSVTASKAAATTPAVAASGFVALSSDMDVRPTKNDNLQQKVGGNVTSSQANLTPLVLKDENRPKDLLHGYKNRLQHYTQKKNIALPEYSCEFDGPPHARLFKASVVIDGRTYNSPEYHTTLKDAEHAAAKVALDSLSFGEIQEDEGFYKTLLQELAQKEGFNFPSYRSVKSGPSHMPTFVSTVEVGDETYQGKDCKTKKQSEMSAARVAYNRLMGRGTINNFLPGCITKENTDVPSLSMQLHVNQPSMGAETTAESYMDVAVGGTGGDLRKGKMDAKSGVIYPVSDGKEPLEVSSSSLNFDVANELQHNIQPNPIPTFQQNLDAATEGEEANAKRHRFSSPVENVHAYLPETSTPSAASCSMHSVSVESDAGKPAGSNSRSAKILILPRGSSIPDGASPLPCSDEKWVAARMEMDQ